MPKCPKCATKQHVSTFRKKIFGRYYWIYRCTECKTNITIDEQENESEIEKDAKKRQDDNRGTFGRWRI